MAHLSVAAEASGNGSDAHIVSRTFQGAVNDAEPLHDTADIVEETQGFALFDIHLHILDDVTATVILTLKAFHARSQRLEFLVSQVDVVILLDIDFAVARQLDIFIHRLQVVIALDHERIFLRALTQSPYRRG